MSFSWSTPARPFSIVALLSLVMSGCGPAEVVNSPEVYNFGTLEEVGGIYRSATNIKKKPPTSLADLSRSRDVFLNGYNSIEKGEIIVVWGVEVTGEDIPTDEILAYKSDVPTSGGPVLLKNLTMKKMSADQFKSAKLAGTETSAASAKAPK
jgi:hypothetical protein